MLTPFEEGFRRRFFQEFCSSVQFWKFDIQLKFCVSDKVNSHRNTSKNHMEPTYFIVCYA